MIQLRELHKTLGGKPILRGLSLTVPNGMNYVLMGPSGVGKSVALRHVIGIIKPDQGSVKVDDVEGQEVIRGHERLAHGSPVEAPIHGQV